MSKLQLTPQLRRFLKSATDEELENYLWYRKNPEYEHKPVSMKQFLSDPQFVSQQDQPREHNRKLLIDVFDNGEYEEVLYIAGIGSGKSYFSSQAIEYIIYRLLCLKDPQSYFRFAKGTKIAFVNISKSFSQAKDVVFGEIKNRIDNSPWFQTFYPYDPRIKSVLRLAKNIYILPLGSNEEAPLGYNIFGAVIDEASFHTATKNKDYAEESYNQIKKRIRSRFFEKGKMFIITSPKYIYDFAEKKFAEDDSPKLYKLRTPLWEAMPPEMYSGKKFDLGKYMDSFAGTMVPIEYEDEFRQNPERAMRDYGAQPSLAIQGFFRDSSVIEMHVNKGRRHPISPRTGDFEEWFVNSKVSGHYDSDKYYIHIDLGLNKEGKGDACGIAMGKFNGWEEFKSVTGKIEKRPKIFIAYMERVIAGPREEILFSDIRKKIYRIKDIGYNIAEVTFDGFQSVDSIQMLNEAGFKSELLSVDRTPEPYYTLKAALLEGRLDYYHYGSFITELQQLEEIKGTKVDHPRGGSKDVADAVAGVCYHCGKGTPGRGFYGA